MVRVTKHSDEDHRAKFVLGAKMMLRHKKAAGIRLVNT